jgi:hypothetical protein
MKQLSKITMILVLVGSLLATNFNTFLVILEDNTMVTLVEELPDKEEQSSDKSNASLKLIPSKIDDYHITLLQSSNSLSFYDRATYLSILLDGITPPPKLA